MRLADDKLTLLQVNFYVQEKLIILILDSFNRSRIFTRREVIILYSSKSVVFHSGQHILKLKTKERLFLEETALRGEGSGPSHIGKDGRMDLKGSKPEVVGRIKLFK